MRVPSLHLPRSLRQQFIVAVSALALLVLIGGLVAVFALRQTAATTHQLAEERLMRLQSAHELVERTVHIERQSARMADAKSGDDLLQEYGAIVDSLSELDALVDRLGATSDDVEVLELHQSSQLFRNMTHVLATLLEERSRRETVAGNQQLSSLLPTLPEQASALVSAAKALSDRYTADYRAAVLNQADTSSRQQRWVLGLLAGSLVLAWVVSHGFLGRHVLNRLQTVSRHLRQSEASAAEIRIDIRGDDEIGEMARAVEQFLEDRRQLAAAHKTLQEERARQEELIRQLAQAHSQLLQSEKLASIGQLAAGVAHEINNPVGFVNSNLGTLRRYVGTLLEALAAYQEHEAELSPATRRVLAELRERLDLEFLRSDLASLLDESADGLQRVKRIVQDLKDFSRVDRAEREPADLEKCLDSTLNVVWNELKYKAEVVKEYAGLPEIECMPSQLNQVFMNLLVNAAQSIETQGRITVRTGSGEGGVWVEVEDTGSGIPPENLARLFDPFFTTKPVGQGTGLGLSIAYSIVKKHGGRIEVASELGTGSRFRVILPVAPLPEEPAHEQR